MSISSIKSTATPQLDASYIQMINDLMAIERQPLTRMTAQRDTITVQKAVYTDLKGLLDGLQTATKGLISGDASYAFMPGRAVQVSAASGQTVLTASANSSTPAASYTVRVDQLATAHRALSNKQTSMTSPLGLSGTFEIGGAGSAAALTTLNGSVEGFSAASVIASGQTELSSGDYTVQTTNDSGIWKFKLLDANGQAVSISDGAGGFTDQYQTILSGNFDTGRGLTIQLGTGTPAYQESPSETVGAAKVNYTAGLRTSITIAAGDKLVDIASNINHASYAAGKEVVATVVGGQLILNSLQTGSANLMSFRDTSGSVLKNLGILNASSSAIKIERAPQDAVIVINDLDPITRSSNTGLTDVIGGVTLNLASDAEGKTATLNVQANIQGEKAALNSFMQNFNNLTSYLNGKLATTKKADGTYSRGSLAGDSALSGLKVELLRLVNADATNSGTLKNLRQIGLSLGDKMQLQISDSSKLEDALTNNKANVVRLVDTVMNLVNGKVGRFTGASGYVTTYQTTLDRQTKDVNDRIARMNQRLDARQAALYTQFGSAQDQLDQMTSQMKMWQSVYSVTG